MHQVVRVPFTTPCAHIVGLLTSYYFHRLNIGSNRRVECPCPRQLRHALGKKPRESLRPPPSHASRLVRISVGEILLPGVCSWRAGHAALFRDGTRRFGFSEGPFTDTATQGNSFFTAIYKLADI